MSVTTIVGMIVSSNGVMLFKSDGNSQFLLQDSYRTKDIAEKVAFALAKDGKIDLAIESFTLEQEATKILKSVVVEKTKTGVTQIKDAKSGSVIVKDATKLQAHIERAVYGKQAKGFKKFLEDFKKVKSNHTVDELLDFMGRNDLPIADDGSILVFKYLDDKGGGNYADHHTGRVTQRLGSLVHMPKEMVDQSRRNQCSSGLHVCSHLYGSYGGVAFLAKVRASDVVAVPEAAQGKMRVAAYHLVKLLPRDVYGRIANRQTMLGEGNDEGARQILLDVITGNHTKVLDRVRVGGSTYVDDKAAVETTKVKQKPGATTKKKKATTQIDVSVPKVNPAKLKADVKAKLASEKASKPTPLAKAVERAETRKTPKQDVVKAPKLTKGKKPLLERLDPTWTDEYLAKLTEAFYLKQAGHSLREVSKIVGADRESLSKNLKRFA